METHTLEAIELANSAALGRLVESGDVARAVLFLCIGLGEGDFRRQSACGWGLSGRRIMGQLRRIAAIDQMNPRPCH
ncbi:hypothetical protein [Cupriavidus basilensis]